MLLGLLVLGLMYILEFLIYLPVLWPFRQSLAPLAVAPLVAFSIVLLANSLVLPAFLVVIISFYRLFNIARLFKNRTQQQFLHRAAFQTSLTLILFQLIVLSAWWLAISFKLSASQLWLGLAIVQLLAAIALLMTTHRQIRSTRPVRVPRTFSSHDLPSLTVCVPARNETLAMEACLQSLAGSDYPKLEILVLDDCSQDHTSDIIREFAHTGIRFIRGTEPPTNWLAKNWAYKRLYEEANGELLLFCGVDIRFEPSSLRTLVATMLTNQQRMISVMPHNQNPLTGRPIVALLLQSMRYAWELCLPRRLLQRPPVLSSCWIADRLLLEHAGGFNAVSSTVTPESYFAKTASKAAAYSFLHSTEQLAVNSQKSVTDQWNTAVRTRYPQLRRKPQLTLLLTFGHLLFLIAPFGLFFGGLLFANWIIVVLAGLAVISLLASYGKVIAVAYGQPKLWACFLLPLAAVIDIYLRHYSMYRYEFKEVVWKGRNVCLPVMHVIPRLPKF